MLMDMPALGKCLHLKIRIDADMTFRSYQNSIGSSGKVVRLLDEYFNESPVAKL
jgi:hypothetical protein